MYIMLPLNWGGNPTKTVFDTAVSFGKVFACVSVDFVSLTSILEETSYHLDFCRIRAASVRHAGCCSVEILSVVVGSQTCNH